MTKAQASTVSCRALKGFFCTPTSRSKSDRCHKAESIKRDVLVKTRCLYPEFSSERFGFSESV
jgi:hypothetical protein